MNERKIMSGSFIIYEVKGYCIKYVGGDQILLQGKDEKYLSVHGQISDDLPVYILKNIQAQGADPANYFSFNNYPIRKQAKECLQNFLTALKAEKELLIPEGVALLQRIMQKQNEYLEAFNQAMEREDTVSLPSMPNEDFEGLKLKYPRAWLYIRAENYSFAENHHKSTTGEKALELIKEGKDAEAEEVLKNWLPESAIWD